MDNSPRARYRRWKLDECLDQHRGLSIIPTAANALRLGGELEVHATGPDGITITDAFQVELEFAESFPARIPTAQETAGRIPRTFHKLKGNTFCLGSPTALRLQLMNTPTITGFVDHLVIPYLYGFCYFTTYGKMPFEELDHGADGLLQHFADLFGLSSRAAAQKMVDLAALKRRIANKVMCPCDSGMRLGRCHNRVVNYYRTKLGRDWFAFQAIDLRDAA